MRVMIAGKRRRGKDTLAEVIQEFRPEVVRAGFADSLKKDLSRMVLNWLSPMSSDEARDVQELLRTRDVMGLGWQWWGELERRRHEDHWIRYFDLNYGHLPYLVVSDLRHHNEAEYGLQNNFLLVRVTGPNRGTEGDQRSDSHPSEIHVDELPVHLEFNNRGTLDDMREFVATQVIPKADLIWAQRAVTA